LAGAGFKQFGCTTRHSTHALSTIAGANGIGTGKMTHLLVPSLQQAEHLE